MNKIQIPISVHLLQNPLGREMNESRTEQQREHYKGKQAQQDHICSMFETFYEYENIYICPTALNYGIMKGLGGSESFKTNSQSSGSQQTK